MLRFFPTSEHALTLTITDHISLAALEQVQSIMQLLQPPPITAVTEILPAYTTITIIFDVRLLDKNITASSTPHEYIEQKIRQHLRQHLDQPFYVPLHVQNAPHQHFQPNYPHNHHHHQQQQQQQQPVKIIPVCYAPEYAPDLAELAAQHGMSVEEVILRHSSAEYRVAMLGFTPGFPYLLGLPPELATPRKQTPRSRIDAGSVGIAGEQTGVYPLSSPGGWNIIGKTPQRLFTPELSPPTFLQSGDIIRFRAVSLEEFEQLYKKELQSKELQSKDLQSKDLQSKDLHTAQTEVFTPTMAVNFVKKVLVVKAGINVSIQDQGRMNSRINGIPQSGAADMFSARCANALVGNTSNDALLEIPFGRLELYFQHETVLALTGIGVAATARLRDDEYSAWFPVASSRPVLVRSGTVLRLIACRGLRAYCAFAGGLDVPLVLGSRSTYTRAHLGGKHGRALRANDELDIMPATASSLVIERFVQAKGRVFPTHVEARFHAPLQTQRAKVLRFTQGKEYSEFDAASIHALSTQFFRVLPASDRMGIRLQMQMQMQMQMQTQGSTEYLRRTTTEQVISRAVVPGTLQCTPDGTLILLLADAQTTGGYPVIGHVCSVDIALAAQLLPNETVQFQYITLQEAGKLYIEQESYLKQLFTHIQWMCRYA